MLKVLDTDVSIMLSLTYYENNKGGGIIRGAVSSFRYFFLEEAISKAFFIGFGDQRVFQEVKEE